jgi:hypothetical protein
MGKYDSAIVFATAMGMVGLFGTMAYLKGRRSTSKMDSIDVSQPFPSAPVQPYQSFASDNPIPTKKSSCGCGH